VWLLLLDHTCFIFQLIRTVQYLCIMYMGFGRGGRMNQASVQFLGFLGKGDQN
jgi:hypothetical protein